MNWIKKTYYKFKAEMALSTIKSLERDRHFINEFFCGETAYPIQLEKWERDMKKARKQLNKYKKYL